MSDKTFRCCNKRCNMEAPYQEFVKETQDPICPKCNSDAFDIHDGGWPCENPCEHDDVSLRCNDCQDEYMDLLSEDDMMDDPDDDLEDDDLDTQKDVDPYVPSEGIFKKIEDFIMKYLLKK